MIEGAITCTSPGAQIAYTATSAAVAIPNNSANLKPNYCRLAATGACFIRVGLAGVVATVNDMLVQNADAVILRTRDLTHIAAIQNSASGVLQISPLDDM